MVGDPGVSFSENSFSAQGPIVNRHKITLSGTGNAKGRYCDGDGCFNFSCRTLHDEVVLERQSTDCAATSIQDIKIPVNRPSLSVRGNIMKLLTATVK